MYFLRIIALYLLCSITLVATVHAAEFTEKQRNELKNLMHEYLVDEQPEILIAMSESLQKREEKSAQQQARETLVRQKAALLQDGNSPTYGDPKGKVVLIEFFDYQCSHCKVASKTVANIMKKHKELRVIFKEFPIFGKPSIFASRAALAASKQGKYLEMHKAIMELQDHPLTRGAIRKAAKRAGVDFDKMELDMNDRKVLKHIHDTKGLARIIGFTYTPVFIVTDNKLSKHNTFFLPGAIPQKSLEKYLRAAAK